MTYKYRDLDAYKDADKLVIQWAGYLHRKEYGKLAMLEKGNAYELIFEQINDSNRNHAENVGLIVGQCFGISRNHASIGNFGVSMRNLYMDLEKSDGVKRRAGRVIMSNNLDSLIMVLPGMVRWLSQKGIKINFRRLYMDVYFWSEKIRRSWASSFYGADPVANKDREST